MSSYEEALTLGQYLQESDRVALYRFLSEREKTRYVKQSRELIRTRLLKESVANGEITFNVVGNKVTYSASKNGFPGAFENVREMKLGKFNTLNIRRLKKFIAQAEVEAIWNFPLPGVNEQINDGYTTISYPFSDLRYYSEGKNKFVGLIRKLKTRDSETLRKLRAS